jgi:uncharacterized membrane protein
MTHLRMTAHFDVPIEKVFEPRDRLQALPGVERLLRRGRSGPGPYDQVGTKFHATMKLLGRRIEGWSEIVEVAKPKLLKITGKGIQGGSLTALYRFTPVGIAGTDVEMEFDYELPAGFLGQIADKLFIEKTVERDLRHSIENFKALVGLKTPVLV